MLRVLVVPVNLKSLNVVSTDTRICENFGFGFVCGFEKITNHINFVSQTAAEL
jgi:hypothetical protein